MKVIIFSLLMLAISSAHAYMEISAKSVTGRVRNHSKDTWKQVNDCSFVVSADYGNRIQIFLKSDDPISGQAVTIYQEDLPLKQGKIRVAANSEYYSAEYKSGVLSVTRTFRDSVVSGTTSKMQIVVSPDLKTVRSGKIQEYDFALIGKANTTELVCKF